MNQDLTASKDNHIAISVVMATYNGARFIEEQINSIIDQTIQPEEIIICDDRSTDNTVVIIQRFQQRIPIKYFVNEERLGVIENFKKAVSLATIGNYIALSDQDDIWMPEKLETLKNELGKIDNETIPAMVYSDLTVIDKNNQIINRSFWDESEHYTYKHCFKTLLFGNFVSGCTIMMNTTMRKEFARMPSNVLMHDVWLALIAFSFGKVAIIPSPLVKYRKHDANVTYDAAYYKKAKLEKRWNVFKMIWLKNQHLSDELILAKQFYDMYSMQLTMFQRKAVISFLKLKNKPFLQKWIVQRIFFKGQWV